MPDVIADLPHAQLRVVSVNEISLDQKESETEPGQPSHNDPVAFRFGAFAPKEHPTKFYIAKISLDVLSRKDGKIHRAEAGFIKLAIDETIDYDGKPQPHIAVFLSEAAGTSRDESDPVLVITRRGYLLNVPWLNPPVGAGTVGRLSRFYTDGGKFCINMQDDQNNVRAVKYLIRPTQEHPNIVTTDESTWVAVGVAEL